MPDRLDQVLDHLETTPLTTGHGFTEGPVWHPDGYFLFTTDPYVYRLDLDSGELTVVRESPAGSNGMTLDLDGRLVMCDGLHRSVTRMESDGYHRARRRIVRRTPAEQAQRCRLPVGRDDVLHRPGSMAEPHARR